MARGELIKIYGDSIFLKGTKQTRLRFHYADVQLIKYRHSKSSSNGAIVGGLLGIVTGVIIGSSLDDCTGSYCIDVGPIGEIAGGV